MAGMQFKVNEDIVREAMNNFKSHDDEMELEILRMSDAVQSFDSAWTGSARNAFGASWTELKGNLATINENLKLLVEDLQNTLSKSEEKETEIADTFESAPDTTNPFAS